MTRVSLKLKGELGLRTLAIFSGNGSKWEPVGVIRWFFSVLAPAVLSPGPRSWPAPPREARRWGLHLNQDQRESYEWENRLLGIAP